MEWNTTLPFIAQDFKALPVPRLMVDGEEIISATETGAADFDQLHDDLCHL
jgi:hypothetical protein